jgi:hypothetical protein
VGITKGRFSSEFAFGIQTLFRGWAWYFPGWAVISFNRDMAFV